MSDGFLITKGVNVGVFGADPSGGREGDLTRVGTQFKGFNGTNWVPIGSGSSFGMGVNFVTNPIADTTEGFTTYDDGAVAAPVDGTGGSPSTLTFTRNTSSPIHGDQDFKLSKSAADGQGEGLAYTFSTGTGFPAGTRMLVSLWHKASANFVSGDNSDLRLYIYDITNSALITPERVQFFYSNGLTETVWYLTSGTSYRLLFHVATTNASAWDFQFKFLFVGPGTDLAGPNIDDMGDGYNPTVTGSGFGTATSTFYKSKRIGDELYVTGKFLIGTAAASPGYLNLPSGLEIDPNKLSSTTNSHLVGWAGHTDTGGSGAFVLGKGLVLFYDGSDTTKIFVGYTNGTVNGQYTKDNVTAYANSGEGIHFNFRIPIRGWSANSAIASNGIMRIADVLANGTRVTGTPPVALGEYRSYLRNAGSQTYTETNGAPADTPSPDDGIHIWTAATFAAADANNNPSRYEIFIGKFKSFNIQYYQTTDRTGFIDVDPINDGSTTSAGIISGYDPTTGILSLAVSTFGGLTNLNVGSGIGSTPQYTNGYFDVFVADNDFQIQLTSTYSEVWVQEGNGHGSTNTKIPIFVNILSQVGSDIMYATSATDGASFTIMTSDFYTMTFMHGGGAGEVGISINSNQLTTNIDSITTTHKLGFSSYNSETVTFTARKYMPLGTVVRPHTNGAPNNTTNASFLITRG